MADSISIPTIGELVRRAGSTHDRVDHVIRTRRIKPVAMAGNARVFSEQDAEFIVTEVRRIAAERERVQQCRSAVPASAVA